MKTVYVVFIKWTNVGMTFNRLEAEQWLSQADNTHRNCWIEPRKYDGPLGV